MSIKTHFLLLKTKGNNEIIDLTPKINEYLNKQNIQEGVMAISVIGTTASIVNMEYEPGLIKDFQEITEKLIPKNILYEHNKLWGDNNSHSHIKASLLGNSKIFSIYNNEIQTGTWQQIVLVDFDNKARVRKITIQILY